ncbi:hypothetical protein [Streptomyces sp. NPDC007905]|uniref:hypothetical protein n=1 Tax=Streptomyces sp. NPDC007905 TaxID=3364788 RepID=UPI0036EA2868
MSSGASLAAHGHPVPPTWLGPTEIEQALFDAKLRGNWGTYFDRLALEPLYFEIQRDKADANPDKVYSVFGHDPRVGGPVWAVYFDEEEFGDWYQDMLEAHRILMSDAGSPWLNIPFR